MHLFPKQQRNNIIAVKETTPSYRYNALHLPYARSFHFNFSLSKNSQVEG